MLPPEYTVLDSTGALVRHVEYTAFGRHANGTAPIADFLFGFTGRPFDDDAALYDYRARWYDPEVGRFASEDPLGFAAGDANLYRYAGNSPVMHVDPSGLCFTGLANAARSVGNVMGGAIASVGSYFGSSSPTLSTLAGSIGQAFGSSVSCVGSSIGQAFSSVGVSAGYLGQAISTVGGWANSITSPATMWASSVGTAVARTVSSLVPYSTARLAPLDDLPTIRAWFESQGLAQAAPESLSREVLDSLYAPAGRNVTACLTPACDASDARGMLEHLQDTAAWQTVSDWVAGVANRWNEPYSPTAQEMERRFAEEAKQGRYQMQGLHPQTDQFRQFEQTWLSGFPPLIATSPGDLPLYAFRKPQEVSSGLIELGTGWSRGQQIDVFTVMTTQNPRARYSQELLRSDPTRDTATTIWYHGTDPWTYVLLAWEARAATGQAAYGRLEVPWVPRGTRQARSAVRVAGPTGDAYSVAFQTELRATSYPGFSRAAHFQEANESFLQMMQADQQFAQAMQGARVNLQRTATGLAPRTPPAGWTWHHAQDPGVMQLVPRPQHTPGSIFWDTLHPGGQGGYSIWGK